MDSELSAARTMTPRQLSTLLNTDILKAFDFKSVPCPGYLLPVAGLSQGSVMQCFGSMSEPEALLAALSRQIKPLAEVQMNWRQDIGVWSSTYKLRNSEQTFGLDVEAPGLSESMRNDPAVNGYRSVLSYIISPAESAT